MSGGSRSRLWYSGPNYLSLVPPHTRDDYWSLCARERWIGGGGVGRSEAGSGKLESWEGVEAVAGGRRTSGTTTTTIKKWKREERSSPREAGRNAERNTSTAINARNGKKGDKLGCESEGGGAGACWLAKKRQLM